MTVPIFCPDGCVLWLRMGFYIYPDTQRPMVRAAWPAWRMLGRVYLIPHVLQHVHILPEGFSGSLEWINVGEQILHGLHSLKRERGGKKHEVGCGWGRRQVKYGSSLMTATVQEVLLAIPRPLLKYTQKPINGSWINSALSSQTAWVGRRQPCVWMYSVTRSHSLWSTACALVGATGDQQRSYDWICFFKNPHLGIGFLFL